MLNTKKIYIYDKQQNDIFYVDYDSIFCCNEIVIHIMNMYDKCKIYPMLLNVFLNDVE